jgi:K+-transporting ATPase ATPase A chain
LTANGWIQIGFFFLAILLVTVPLGAFMYRVLEGESHFLSRPLGWLERFVYRLGGVDGQEQSWKAYTGGMLAFSAFTMLVTYAIQRLQQLLPFNPQGMAAVEEGSAFNTAASFTTNTNWQGYVGETTMSYLSQMAGLAWHNFTSAAAGIAIAIALARGLTRRGDGKGPGTIGNFWVDITRATVYILLPLSILFSLVFVSQGMIQNLNPYQAVTTLEGANRSLPWDPWPPRRRSSSSGPTAAVSSTRTRRIPSRTRTP